MALGLPVVGTKSGGIVETVQNGKCGILVPVGDSQALANAIVRILSDRNLATRLGKNAYERVANLYSAKIYADKISKFYVSLLNES
jgi:glycosyltransferase involved in cell wall biosynthesis